MEPQVSEPQVSAGTLAVGMAGLCVSEGASQTLRRLEGRRIRLRRGPCSWAQGKNHLPIFWHSVLEAAVFLAEQRVLTGQEPGPPCTAF